MRRLIATGHLGGVPVYVHWTVLAACLLVLVGAVSSLNRVAAATMALLGYFSAVLLHEWGHVVLARKRRCQVYAIALYPLVGITRLEHPRTRLDHCLIAWGGILFQGAVGLPMLAWIAFVGYTRIEAVNAFMAMVGYLTLVMLPLNLAAVPPLDGAVAWGIVPILLRRARENVAGRKPKRWDSAR